MTNWLEKFQDLPVTAVSDGLDKYNHLWPTIKPVKDTQKVVGYAKTVQIPPGDNQLVLKAIREAQEGEVLIVDAGGYVDRAAAGDFIMGLAQTMGYTGAIINGAVRDIQEIRDLDFPVFCAGATPAAGFKHGHGSINEPISFNGVVVHPGDLIVAEEDGVVCVPRDRIEEVYEKAQNKLKKDEEREAKVLRDRAAVVEYLDGQLNQ
ncbi:RraA family protein [Virgibacillus sp. MSP4-1]|uniref:RraA family protein n=1 Tax=Virgibacillus sp. MSP4-1 TaxID=2700081 RepID=UPI00039E8429|nr:hypothetical protein [Virgibacillus sp. MSP4-1]QHS23340.1 RraA family protein [Virgibacillus sp. MSP4-1]